MKGLKEKVVRGAMAKIGAQGANFLLRIGSLMVFARLLEPGDFGLIGMVTVVTGVLSLFKDFGLSTATIQRNDLNDVQSSTLFWLNLLVGAILWVLMSAIAPILVAFYDEPRLLPVTLALATGFLINAAGVQHAALLQREMRFVTLAAIEVIALLVSSAVAIVMAIAGLAYWALVGWSLLLPALNTIGAWAVAAWVPGAPQRKAGLRSVIHFGGTVTVNIVVVYIAYNLDKILVARLWGASALGIYGRAYQLVSLPSDSLIGAVGGVAFSALSRVRDDRSLLRSYFLKGYQLVLTLTVPITAFFLLFAEDIVLVVLGPKWSEATPIFRLLTPTLLVFAMINPTGWLLLSIGMVGRSLKIALVIAPLVISGYVLGSAYGSEGVAFGFSAAMILWAAPHIFWSMNGTGIAALDLFKVMIKPFVAGIAAAIVTFGLEWFVGQWLPPILRLLFGGTILFASYIALLVWVMHEKTFYLNILSTLTGQGSVREEAPK